MVRYSDELLDEIRSRNDIVDVISQYVTIKRKEETFLDYVLFTMRNHHHFLYHQISKSSNVLDVVLEEMYFTL